MILSTWTVVSFPCVCLRWLQQLITNGHVPAVCIGDGWYCVRLLKMGITLSQLSPRACVRAVGCALCPMGSCLWLIPLPLSSHYFSNGANGWISYGDMTIIHTNPFKRSHCLNRYGDMIIIHTYTHKHKHTYLDKCCWMSWGNCRCKLMWLSRAQAGQNRRRAVLTPLKYYQKKYN